MIGYAMTTPTGRAVWDSICDAADEADVMAQDILGHSRLRHIARARQAAYWLAHKRGVSFAEIGRQMGRDHTTVIYGYRAAQRRFDSWKKSPEKEAQ